jgi:hypothetical protein
MSIISEFEVKEDNFIGNNEYINCPQFYGKVIAQTKDSYLIMPAHIAGGYPLSVFWLKKACVRPYRVTIYKDMEEANGEKVSHLSAVMGYDNIALTSLSVVVQQFINQVETY